MRSSSSKVRASAGARCSVQDLIKPLSLDVPVHPYFHPYNQVEQESSPRRSGREGARQRTTARRGEIGVILAGPDGVIWPEDGMSDEGAAGRTWLDARSISIAGGTNEMQRNIVSERLLGMPREPATDRDVPFSEVVIRRQKR